MNRPTSSPQQTINNLFSLIDANETRIAVLNAVNAARSSAPAEIRWADFDTRGHYIRGGLSYPQLLSSRLVHGDAQEGFVREVKQLVGNRTISPGELLPSREQDGYYWATPARPEQQTLLSSNGIRMIFITDELVEEVLRIFYPDAKITRAEFRVIYQILADLPLTEAAEADGVAKETKRTQLKRAMQKLGVSRQVELTRIVFTQLIQILHACESFETSTEITENFVSRFLEGNVNLSVTRLRNGNLMRYLEVGPRDGREILVMHGYLLPLAFMYARKALDEQNMKLVIPLRKGYLDSDQAATLDEVRVLTDENLQNLLAFARERLPKGTPLIAFNLGCSYATYIYKALGAHFSCCVIASAQLMAHRATQEKSRRAQFIEGFRSAMKNNSVFMESLRYFKRAVLSNSFTSGQILQRLVEGSDSDARLIADPKERQFLSKMHSEIFRTSLPGLSSDVLLIDHHHDDPSAGEIGRIDFLHGEEATLAGLEDVRAYAAKFPDSRLDILPEVGFYFSASHPYLLWEEFRRIMDENDSISQAEIRKPLAN